MAKLVAAKIAVREIDRGWRRLREVMKTASDAHAKVGYLAGKGAEDDHDGLTNAELGIVHEFGTGRVPERSHIRATIDRNREAYLELLKRLTRGIYEGKMTAERALGILGLKAASDVKRYITSGEGVPPPLDAGTIARKGSTRALVDTGRLVASILHEVVMGKEIGRAAVTL